MGKYFIMDFYDEVKKGAGTFSIQRRDAQGNIDEYFFSVRHLGTGSLEYGGYVGYNGTSSLDGLDLVAVISANGKIYVLNMVFFRVYLENAPLPEEVSDISEFQERTCEYVSKELFPMWFEKLQPSPLSEKRKLDCKKEARKILLHVSEIIPPKFEFHISTQEMLECICELQPLHMLANKAFENQRGYFQILKAKYEEIQRLVKEDTCVSIEEYTLADATYSSGTKYVSVEFEWEGKRETAKIKSESILKNLAENSYFTCGDFSTMKEERQLILFLGIPYWSLKCDRISRIIAKGKIIYERQ